MSWHPHSIVPFSLTTPIPPTSNGLDPPNDSVSYTTARARSILLGCGVDVLEVPTSKDGHNYAYNYYCALLTWCIIVLDGYFYVFVVISVNVYNIMVLMSSRFVIMLLYLVLLQAMVYGGDISLHKHVNLNVT